MKRTFSMARWGTLSPLVFQTCWAAILGAMTLPSGAIATEVIATAPETAALDQINTINHLDPAQENQPEETSALAAVTSVSQLSDVQPTDWAFQALQSLVERYGCIAGYPNGTYKGNRAMTRYEFAAGLNACLDRVNELIAAATADLVTKDDLLTLQKLQEAFAAELATLRGRVDAVEAKTAELEANQFSTTTKLQGEVIFTVADSFSEGDPTETVFTDRVRLTLTSSFTGKDKFYTRLTTGNGGDTFATELGTQEGRLAYDGQGDNVFSVDRLHYAFPINKYIDATVMASFAAHHFYVDTFNPILENGGGGTGAIGKTGERNPQFRMNIGGQGLGLRFKFSKKLEASLGYLTRTGSNPDAGAGIFNGSYSALAQVVFKPSKTFKFGVSYLRGLDQRLGAPLFGTTGTNLGNLNPTTLAGLGIDANAAASDNVAANFYWRVAPKFDLRGWFGYTSAQIFGDGGDTDADILNYAFILGFPDLGKKGNFGAIILAASPYLVDLEPENGAEPAFDEDIPLHVEVLYKHQINKNINVTPGLIWLVNPNQSDANDDVLIGVVRTTFTF